MIDSGTRNRGKFELVNHNRPDVNTAPIFRPSETRYRHIIFASLTPRPVAKMKAMMNER
jgi:hypothetical protein